jgi:alkylation response protein AidB-like acyl-CoA dehydrogenase
MVDYADTAAEASFRARVQDWLRENAPKDWGVVEDEYEEAGGSEAWHRALYNGGLIGLSWPVEVGGQGLPRAFESILAQEVGRAGAPPLPQPLMFVGHALMRFGTVAQVERFLPPLMRGEEVWCQGFSEPSGGSDLAALRTVAVPQGDIYVVNGQKMWTSQAHRADWCFLLARTQPEAPKHKGISCFLVSMRSPGIEVRPIMLANGVPHTNEVFWDSVMVPAQQRLGEDGDGWKIAVETLVSERGIGSLRYESSYGRRLGQFQELILSRSGADRDRAIAAIVGKAFVAGEAHRLAILEQLSIDAAGRPSNGESSVGFLLRAASSQVLGHAIMDFLGVDGLTGPEKPWFKEYLRSRIESVAGGTSQIQRNIVAKRVLGMV